MDHVPLPRYCSEEALDIPYICEPDFEYDCNLPFDQHGPALGWPSEMSEVDRNSPGLAVVAQKWLFFGLAIEFFRTADIKIRPKDFTRTTGGRTLVSTSPLRSLLSSWASGIKNLDHSRRTTAAETVERILTVAQVTTNNLYEDQDILLSQVVLSVLWMGATLTYFRREVFKDHGICPLYKWTGQVSYRNWIKSEFLTSYMRRNGWCLSEIAYVSSSVFSILGVGFAARLGRPKREYSHASCKETACNVLQVDEETYETAHATPGCKCDHIEMDTNLVCKTIHRGGIPIVKMVKPSDSDAAKLKVDLIEGSERFTYIAISHVWAHGLGHVTKNALPECQYERLYNLLQELDSSSQQVFLWIDTVCVPARPHAEACLKGTGTLGCRKIAINRLKEVYQNAVKVLVLDWELQNSRTSFSEETLMRISISAWMRRLWTFQEARLAQSLYFQFADKAVELGDLLTNLDITEYHGLWAETAEHCLDLKSNPSHSADASKIVSVWNSLQSRATSVLDDEAICLSIILGADTQKILDTPEKERMRTLYSMLDIVPSQLLVMPGPRLNADGYGWAPGSFLSSRKWANGEVLRKNQLHHQVTHTMNYQSRLGFRSEVGLFLKLPGILLKSTNLPLEPYFSILDSKDRFLGAAVYMMDLSMPRWENLKVGDLIDLAILLQGRPQGGSADLAVLLKGCAEERGVIFGKYVCRLWFGAARDGETAPKLSFGQADADTGSRTTEVARGCMTSLEQTWCIS